MGKTEGGGCPAASVQLHHVHLISSAATLSLRVSMLLSHCESFYSLLSFLACCWDLLILPD